MNAITVLEQCKAAGIHLSINGERLHFKASAPLPDALLSDLRAHKAELLELLAANQSPDAESINEWYQERAAIMEADGGLSADEANRQARARTLARFGLPTGYLVH